MECSSAKSMWKCVVDTKGTHRATLEQIAVAFERQVEHRVEERVARANEGGERLTLRCD